MTTEVKTITILTCDVCHRKVDLSQRSKNGWQHGVDDKDYCPRCAHEHAEFCRRFGHTIPFQTKRDNHAAKIP
jgi:hypothetical protein